MSGERLDRALVHRGLVSSREKAQRLIEAGFVQVNGQVSLSCKKSVSDAEKVEVTQSEKFVSRGGYKLEAALNHFQINVADLICLDVGASTGGFTDCLLQNGVKSVLAIDVGHDQLDKKIGSDLRVESREGINVRHWVEPELAGKFQFVCVDVSFISLKLVLPALFPLIAEQGYLVLLVKPQFEVGRENVGSGGIVREAKSRQEALDGILSFLSLATEWNILGSMDSPVEGKAGNREYLVCAIKSNM